MDKTFNSSGESSAAITAGNRDQYLRQLHKLSHKIAKPTTSAAVNRPEFDPNPSIHLQAPPRPPATNNQGNLHQNQPPVYNINKSDFRDVVQRLTGSPALERISAPSLPPPPPPAIHHPRPQSSRLQRIRPPPLSHVSNRPPPLLNGAILPMNASATTLPPLSPLPPLPPVHAAAESPVSAYMRYLHSSVTTVDSNQKQFSGFSPLTPLVSPRWYQQQENILPPTATATATAPTSASVSAPRSPYALLSPSILLSPTPNQVGFPLSPTTLPVPSPTYKGQ